MGFQLVKAAMVHVWPLEDMTHAARVIIVRMATQAVDADKPPTYFAGWEPLALSLGYTDHAPGSAAQKAVSRAIAELTAAGFVKSDPTTPRSHKRRYTLHLPGL